MIKINDKIEVILITSNRTGVLSSIMRISTHFGLMLVKNKPLKIDENHTRLILLFNGRLNTSKYDFTNELISHTEIYTVERVVLNYSNNLTQPTENTNKKYTKLNSNLAIKKLRSSDLISQESRELAEQLLSGFLGPVAVILVEAAAAKTKHIGDLYLLLSEELEGKERTDFLQVVDGLDPQMM